MKKHIEIVTILLINFMSTNIIDAQNKNDTIKEDKTRTNPTLLDTAFNINNTYNIQGDNSEYFNKLNIVFENPIPKTNGKTMIRATVPYISTNKNEHLSSLGNVNLRFIYVPFVNQKFGSVVYTDVDFNTTTEKKLRNNKTDIEFGYTQAFFFKKERTFALAYLHSLSLYNNVNIKKTNNGAFDLYFIKKFRYDKAWITFDYTYNLDFADEINFNTLKFEYALMIGHGISLALNYGYSFGENRPFNYQIGSRLNYVY